MVHALLQLDGVGVYNKIDIESHHYKAIITGMQDAGYGVSLCLICA